MYADDVTAVVSTASQRELEAALNLVMEQLHQWFQANGLALNKEKTSYMTFKLNGHTIPTTRVCAGGAPIQHVNGARLLGFHLDSALTWETHIDELCKRVGKACGARVLFRNSALAPHVRRGALGPRLRLEARLLTAKARHSRDGW